MIAKHEIVVLIAHAQKLPLNAKLDISNGARVLQFGTSLYIHTYFVYASSEESGESAHVRRLTIPFVARQCGKNQYNEPAPITGSLGFCIEIESAKVA